ncbi:MAG TPA: hypothetical protein VJY39_21325 [Acidisphaera sp.]|nr:hypothetical protein [Acidisphaera sp.]
MHSGIGGGWVGQWLAIFAVIFVIYAGWRITVAIQARRARHDAPAAPANPALARSSPLATLAPGAGDDIVVIAAAAYAIVGRHRIVHIEAADQNQTWAIEGRWLHQTSHRPR